MRIGLSTSVIQRGKTGIAQYVFALLRAFDQMDVDHQFTLFTLEEDLPLFSNLSRRFTQVAVSERFRPAVKNISWHQSSLPGLAAQHQLDLLHVPSYRRLLWSAPCPRVATIHDLAPFRVAKKYDLARMIYGRVVVKHLARKQDAIIAVSKCTARDIEQFFGIPQNQVTVILNGVDHDRFYPHKAEEVREFVVRKELAKPFLLYVARLEHPGKNHVRLIEAFEDFKRKTKADWQLVFGGSDWHGAELIHQRIGLSPYRTDIRNLGFVRDEELPLYYSAAAGFVYPSLYEGFGMPPVEAMACACPVICSDRGSLGEVVQQAAKIINPEKIESISEALQNLHATPAERQEWVRRGLIRAAELSWEKAARQTMEVYLRMNRSKTGRNSNLAATPGAE